MMSGAALKGPLQTVLTMAIGSVIPLWTRYPQRGFTYLGTMFLIIFIGIGLAKAGLLWQTEVQREREKELLFIGEQYANAIGSYFESTPSGPKQYPASFEELLQDHRFPSVRRHLRKVYSDPITGGEKWGLIKQQGRIAGVYSLALQRPLKKAGFSNAWATFADAESYTAWQFTYTPGILKAVHWPSLNDGGSVGAFPQVQSSNSVSEDNRNGSGVSVKENPSTSSDLNPKQALPDVADRKQTILRK